MQCPPIQRRLQHPLLQSLRLVLIVKRCIEQLTTPRHPGRLHFLLIPHLVPLLRHPLLAHLLLPCSLQVPIVFPVLAVQPVHPNRVALPVVDVLVAKYIILIDQILVFIRVI